MRTTSRVIRSTLQLGRKLAILSRFGDVFLSVLDVGSGTGTFLAPLAPLHLPGGSIIGIDLS